MRILFYSCVAGAVLSLGISMGAWAQDQPAAGSPPPAATAPAQTQNAAPPPAPAAMQNEAPPTNAEMPPPQNARKGPNPHRQARMMARRLGLTAEQQTAIEPILAKRDQRMEKVRGNAELAPAMRRARVRRISRESAREIHALLTNTQRKEFKQLRQERRARRLQREQQAAAPAPGGNP